MVPKLTDSAPRGEHFCFPPKPLPASFPTVTNNPVYHFFHTPGNPGPLVLRMTLAGIFFYHGAQKTLGWFGGPGWTGTISAWSESLGLPTAVAAAVIVAEILISASMFFGFLTRLSGLAVVVVKAGAIFALSRGAAGLMDFELPVLVLASGLTIFFMGGGALSIDRAISRNLLPMVG